MENKERPKPSLVSLVSENELPKMSDAERTAKNQELIAEYECGVEAKPEWCIWVNDGGGGAAVLYFIRPAPEGEMVARRIAKYLQSQGTHADVEMTEWNPHQQGKPIYREPRPVMDDLNDGPDVWHG